MTIADGLIILATLIGPIAAVQTQKWVERGSAAKARRMEIFRTLMATRASFLNPNHVEALNAIPVEFYTTSDKRLKKVTDEWRLLFDHFNIKEMANELWHLRRAELLTNVLVAMSEYLGFAYNKSEINQIYHPEGFNAIEADNVAVRRGFARLFNGEAAFPIDLTGLPTDPEAVEVQLKAYKLFSEWMEGKRAPVFGPSGNGVSE